MTSQAKVTENIFKDLIFELTWMCYW